MHGLDGQCPSGCCKKWLVGRFGLTYNRLQRVFHGISKYIIRFSGRFKGMIKSHKDEDYVCSFLGLLGIEIKVEYGICVESGLQEKAIHKIGSRTRSCCECVFTQLAA